MVKPENWTPMIKWTDWCSL